MLVIVNFKFALVLLTFLFEVRKDFVLDGDVRDKDVQGLKWIKNCSPSLR